MELLRFMEIVSLQLQSQLGPTGQRGSISSVRTREQRRLANSAVRVHTSGRNTLSCHSGFLLRRNVSRRERSTLTKEVILHLLGDDFLRLFCGRAEAVFIDDHLQVLQPHVPCLL